MASGLVLTYSTSGIFNFSHGAIAFVTALLFFELNTAEGWSTWAAAVVSILVFAPALGYFLDRIMFRRLSTAGEMPQIVATVGLSIALPAAAIFLVERLIGVQWLHLASPDNVLTVPGLGPTPTQSFSLGNGVSINTDQLATLAAAIVSALFLWLLVRHTPIGLRMRATVDRRSLAGLRKINADRSSGLAWLLGAGLAGLAGVLAAPLIGLAAANFTGLMLTSAAAAVFAGLRSIPLAFAAGIALGVVQDVAAGYLLPHVNIPGLADSIPFILLLLGLLVVNKDRKRSTRVATEEAPPASTDYDLPSWRRGLPWAVGAVALIGFTFLFADSFWVGLVVSGMCAALIFLSYVVITGTGGLVSLAQAAFVTSAAMIAGLMIAHGWPFAVSLLAGVGLSVLLGVRRLVAGHPPGRPLSGPGHLGRRTHLRRRHLRHRPAVQPERGLDHPGPVDRTAPLRLAQVAWPSCCLSWWGWPCWSFATSSVRPRADRPTPCALHRWPPDRRASRGRGSASPSSSSRPAWPAWAVCCTPPSTAPSNRPTSRPRARCCGWPSSSPWASAGPATPSSPD